MENSKPNIYEKIQIIRVALVDAKLKKTGKNSYSGFTYYTLDDLLPAINKEMLKQKVLSIFNIEDNKAILELINADNVEEKILFTSPMAEAKIQGASPVQCLGGIHTYLKRYLYLNAFEIAEADLLDNLAGSEKLETKDAKASILDPQLLEEASDLKIDLNKLAAYKKKELAQLTNEDLKAAIKQKREALGGTL